MYRIGIDVGGTFTDLVAVTDAGTVHLAKAASTPTDPSLGVMSALEHLASQLDGDTATILGKTSLIVHGTTVATNALVERKGARVALLATEGHRDIIEMREGLKPDRYNLQLPPPAPLVPRRRRLAIRERIRANGDVDVSLDAGSVERALEELKELNVQAVAICFLHSYRNAVHEEAVARLIRKSLPNHYLSVSSSVLPKIKEYERTWTTIVNAYVGPVLSEYLHKLENRLAEVGYEGAILIMQSSGGVAPIGDAVRLAAGCVLSGPAGGVAASAYAGELIQEPNLLTLDMGGTSTDISRIVAGKPQTTADKGVGDIPVALPSLDIITLGAGGGSIATVDRSGILRVGPESAGADPGPACYGRGGDMATVTDASLVLGYLDPSNFLGGRMHLNERSAERVIGVLATQLGVDIPAAAYGVHEIVNLRMAEGIRLVSIKRGIDPRKFALLAFGGAAGLHVTDVARQLSIRRALVPRQAAVLSAWGMLVSDLRYERVATRVAPLKSLEIAELRRMYLELESDLRQRLKAADDGAIAVVQRSADLRYGEQTFEIEVGIDGLALDSDHLASEMALRFHQRHEELYTYSLPDQDVIFVNARVAVTGKLPELPVTRVAYLSEERTRLHARAAYIGAWQEMRVLAWDSIAPGSSIKGPAVIEADDTTVLLRDGDSASMSPLGWLDIRVGSQEQPPSEHPRSETPAAYP